MSEVKFPCPIALDKLKKGNAIHAQSIKDQSEIAPLPVGVNHQDKDNRGQWPYAAILSCADSRVIPERMFTAAEGELFVVRVAGNISNTSSIASLEYAVKYLGVRVIAVIGHESCGAVDAAIKQAKDRIDFESNLNRLLSYVVPAINDPTHNDLEVAVRKNAQLTAGELLAQSSILEDYYKNHGLNIFHGYYQIYGPNAGKVDGIDGWHCSKPDDADTPA